MERIYGRECTTNDIIHDSIISLIVNSGHIMNPVKTGLWGIVIILLLIAALPCEGAQQDALPLVNGTGIYLTTGQTWTFYQGYSLTLKSVSDINDRGWIQLKLNDTVVESAIISQDEIFYYNVTVNVTESADSNLTVNSSNETVLFSLKVSGIYSGEDTDIVTFAPVYQYYDPTMPDPTPIQTVAPDNSGNASGTPTSGPTSATRIPGFGVLLAVIILFFCVILVTRKYSLRSD